jgi:hypothetical protein
MPKRTKFVRFEYDLTYYGGNYSDVGTFVLVNHEHCKRLGYYKAFQEHTGHNAIHVIHYSEDELYDCDGNEIE